MDRKKTSIIIISILVILSIVLIAWQINKQTSENETSYQNIEDINRQEADQQGVSSVRFINFGSLTDRGATTNQITNLKKALTNFKPETEEVVIFSTSLKAESHPENPNINPSATFILTIDNVSYNAKIEYLNQVSLSAIHLYLYDMDNNQVYDSGILGN